ncbi:LPD7 domain-containing protein [Bradyrhizobium sp. Ai1a-2]|uniref:LPD7 domain-containing protein n=1 Tax=Bradyrhizobium sp. Ai1a-2 TaxID=196490 RepID=UPI0004854734|nr:LPD7 domain-containing protein [Bradyrhizobium sp. Ai1a-2]
MNAMRDDSEDFSLKRQDRTGREPGPDKPSEDSTSKSAPTDKSPSATVDDKALPDRIRRKYYVVTSETGKHGPDAEARLYADERGEYLAFKVTGDRLITRLAAAEVIRDMVAVAQHRQWESIQVHGSVEFRREAWLEAGARGIEVQGYRPTDLDRQALSDRQETWNRTHPRAHEAEGRPVASDRNERAERPDYDKGIAGRLIEVSRAPYRNRNDAESSPYLAIELANGRRHQVWGMGLEKPTADSNAQPGDRVHVRRDGVEQVTKEIKVTDAANGRTRTERRQVPRNRWRVTAEKFRSIDRDAAARDPDLVAAQSQMVLIEKALERVFPNDEAARHTMMEAARGRIALHLEQGHSFGRATVIEPVQDRHRLEGDRAQARQIRTNERIRIQQRER